VESVESTVLSTVLSTVSGVFCDEELTDVTLLSYAPSIQLGGLHARAVVEVIFWQAV
jgi:hypothetical protein